MKQGANSGGSGACARVPEVPHGEADVAEKVSLCLHRRIRDGLLVACGRRRLWFVVDEARLLIDACSRLAPCELLGGKDGEIVRCPFDPCCCERSHPSLVSPVWVLGAVAAGVAGGVFWSLVSAFLL